jgi:beta-lactamase class A
MGFYVKDLRTGATATLNADQKLRSASLYKLWVLNSAFAHVQSGDLAHDETIALSHDAFLVDPYNEWPEGTQTSADCAIKAMVTVSSNSSAEMLTERVGGSARITADAQAYGAKQTEITDELAFTSPADVGRLLEAVASRHLISPTVSDAILQLLLAQQVNDRIPLPLPPSVKVAHKTGELVNLRNDAGIVYAPSGAYVIVAMVSDAPSEADAAATIVDLSGQVYSFLERGELATYQGLPPRLGPSVFQVADSQERLRPLWDSAGQTVSIAPKGVALTADAKSARVLTPALPDLQALQAEASAAGVPFWVNAGYRLPRGMDWSKEIHGPSLGCQVIVPTPTPSQPAPTPVPTPGPSPTPQPPPHATQHWLGTVITVSNNPDGPASADYPTSDTGRWLLDNGWRFGYIPALGESPAGKALGYEPWDLRWVGRVMAKHLFDQHPLANPASYSSVVAAELQKAIQDLAAQGAQT